VSVNRKNRRNDWRTGECVIESEETQCRVWEKPGLDTSVREALYGGKRGRRWAERSLRGAAMLA